MLHCEIGSDFAPILPAHAVGEREEPTVRARLLFGFGGRETEKILIVVPDAALIGKLGELHFQHGCCGKRLATDGHRYTPMESKELIRVHPCESVAQSIFLKRYMAVGRMASVTKVVRPAALLLRTK